jgi:hypothetical protein
LGFQVGLCPFSNGSFLAIGVLLSRTVRVLADKRAGGGQTGGGGQRRLNDENEGEKQPVEIFSCLE